MKKDSIQLTQQGFDDLQAELRELKDKRPAVLAEVDRMRALGDLKENAGYEQTRREQAFLDGRIVEIEEILKDVVIIQSPAGDTVALGSRVTLHIEGDKVEYLLVDENESDITAGKVSSTSPIGEALLGKAVGDEVDVVTPSGTIRYKILEVS